MPPRTITLQGGREVAIPFIGGRRLTRFGSALQEFSEIVTVDVNGQSLPLGGALLQLQLREYPKLILLAFQTILSQTTPIEQGLTRAEELFYGTIGELIAMPIGEVADLPLDDLSALCQAIWEQEAQTQAGKWLIRTLLGYGEPTTTNAQAESSSGLPTDTTTPVESDPTPATTGAA